MEDKENLCSWQTFVLLCGGWAGLGCYCVEGGQVWGGGWAGLGCYCVEGGQVWGAAVWRVGRFGVLLCGGWAGLGWRVGRFGVLLCGWWAGLGCYSPQSVTGQDSMCQRAERSVRDGSDRL